MPYHSQSRNILVLEDHEPDEVYINCLINDLGFVSIVTSTRNDFLEKMASTSYYACILDNNVPFGKSRNCSGPVERDVGVDLAYKLVIEHPKLKVALHTADSQENNPRIDQLVRRGFRNFVYIPKPALQEDLQRFLQSA